MAPRSYTLSQQELQALVAKSFPRQYPLLGLVTMEVYAPTLRLLPETNRINATMTAKLSGKVLPQSYDGGMDLDFALRYEPTDHSLRATAVKVNSLMMTGLPDAVSTMLHAYAPRAAEQAMDNVVLHQLRDEDLAKLKNLERAPATFTVTPDGLRIDFVESK
ncbi:MAG: DUF1439 domain-containing protein [Comamonas sp.]